MADTSRIPEILFSLAIANTVVWLVLKWSVSLAVLRFVSFIDTAFHVVRYSNAEQLLLPLLPTVAVGVVLFALFSAISWINPALHDVLARAGIILVLGFPCLIWLNPFDPRQHHLLPTLEIFGASAATLLFIANVSLTSQRLTSLLIGLHFAYWGWLFHREYFPALLFILIFLAFFSAITWLPHVHRAGAEHI